MMRKGLVLGKRADECTAHFREQNSDVHSFSQNRFLFKMLTKLDNIEI